MGQHLAAKGKEYARRSESHQCTQCSPIDFWNSCIFRNKPVRAGSDIYLPASFPPDGLENKAIPTPLVLSDKEMGEVCLYSYISQSLFTYLQLRTLLVYANIFLFFFYSPELRIYTALKNTLLSLKYVYLWFTRGSTHSFFRHFCIVRMLLYMLTIYFISYNRSNCKSGCRTCLRTYVGNIHIIRRQR